MSNENKVIRGRKWELLSLTGLVLLTASLVALEVSLTRLFSFMFENSYVYIMISAGISGIGVGGFIYHKFGKYLTATAALTLTFLPVFFMVLLFAGGSFFYNVYFSLIVSFLLFIDIGINIVRIYKESTLNPAWIYFIDLLGASAGSIFGYFMIQYLGVPKTIQLDVFLLIIGIWLTTLSFTRLSWKSLTAGFSILIAFGLSSFVKMDFLITPPNSADKEIGYIIKNNKAGIAETRWTAFGRTDLLDMPGNFEKVMFIDGSAGTIMLRYDNNMSFTDKMENIFQNNLSLAAAVQALNPAALSNTLVIGSGGGIDVTTMLALGVSNITAVEINPDFINIVRKYSAFNGGIYDKHPNVQIVNEEGRHFVRSTKEGYGSIVISLPLIKSIRNYANYAMSENYIFTRDAFTEYRHILKNNGYFFIVAHSGQEIFRLLMNVLDSFAGEGVGISDALKRIAIVEIGHRPVMILKKEPYTKEESVKLHFLYHAVPKHQQNESMTFIPNIRQASVGNFEALNGSIQQKFMFNTFIYDLSEGRLDIADFQKFMNFKMSSISDDSPFFYYFMKGIPSEILTVFLAGIVLLILIFRSNKTGTKDTLYFILIGVGFIMIEIGFIQKFGFFWGQQTMTLAVLISAILLSSGLGSLFSQAVKNDGLKIKLAAIAIPVLTGLSIILSSIFLRSFENALFITKAGITLLFIFPQFFLMGFVFPTMLRNIKPDDKPVMIALNSVASLAGGALAITVAILYGFTFTLVVGGLLYIGLLFYRMKHA